MMAHGLQVGYRTFIRPLFFFYLADRPKDYGILTTPLLPSLIGLYSIFCDNNFLTKMNASGHHLSMRNVQLSSAQLTPEIMRCVSLTRLISGVSSTKAALPCTCLRKLSEYSTCGRGGEKRASERSERVLDRPT